MLRPRTRPTVPAPAGRRLPAALLLAATVLFVLAPVAALAWDAMGFSATDESALLTWVNQQRVSHGLASLATDGTLAAEARSRARDMGDRYAATGSTSVFSHQIPPDGHTAFDEIRASGYCYVTVAENFAWNNYPDADATTTVEGQFAGSATHMNNILGSSWTRTGVGAYKDSVGMHVYVQLFAQPCSGTSPTPTPTPIATPTTRPASTTRPSATPTPTVAPSPTPAFGVLGITSTGLDPAAAPSSQPLGPELLIAPPQAPFLALRSFLELFMAIIRSLIAMMLGI